jgi:hemoglobin
MSSRFASRARRALAATALIVASAGSAHADDSLYQALGGKEKIQAFTKDFVVIITTDPRIMAFFKGSDLPRLETMLVDQFCELTGGPCKYKGRTMQDVHDGNNADGRKVADRDFNALAEDLQIAMERAGVPSRASNKLVALLAPMQRDVVPGGAVPLR